MELGRRPTGVALVASRAVGARRDMVGALARRVAAVVTTGADGGTREGAVISLGAGPATDGLVATLASGRRGNVAAVLAAGNGAVVAA